MTLQDYSLTAFTVLNGVRIVAYLPQIVCVLRDRAGASSVSMVTWGMFFSANLATVSYALTVTGDNLVAAVFAANAIACVLIFALILSKRMAHAWSGRSLGRQPSRTTVRSAFSAFLAILSDRDEDRIAARHANVRWSDAVERSINEDWRAYRCGHRY